MLLLAACRSGARAQVLSIKEEIAAATKIQAAKRGKDARAQVRSQRVAVAEAAEAAEAAEEAAARARQQADAWAREAKEAEEMAAAIKIQAMKRGKDARGQVHSQRVAAAEAAEVAAARARQQADAWARETREAESKAREAKLAAAELALAERIQAAEIARRSVSGSVSQSPSTRALATPAESPIVLLRQLKRLLDDGLITPKQFEVKREELLARWVNGNR